MAPSRRRRLALHHGAAGVRRWDPRAAAGSHRAFGSLPVRASLGSTRWSTSLFFDTRSSSYLLPVKVEIRRRERIENGDTATVRIEVDG